MNSATLDSIKESAARISREYTNGWLNARLAGAKNTIALGNDCLRVVYLAGMIDYVHLIDSTPYLGYTSITEELVLQASHDLWHYSGRYRDIDLEGYSQIVPDDGDGECIGGGTTGEDHYRSGNIPVVKGANAVTFIKDGVASPLPSADYTVESWVKATSGQRQSELVLTTRTAGGFVASDVLKSGTLHYIATLNT